MDDPRFRQAVQLSLVAFNASVRWQVPRLRVLAAHPGLAPSAACQPGDSIFWVLLAGMYRTFSSNVPNLQGFLSGSARCSFVTLYTLDTIESSDGGLRSGVAASGHQWWRGRFTPGSIRNYYRDRIGNESVVRNAASYAA